VKTKSFPEEMARGLSQSLIQRLLRTGIPIFQLVENHRKPENEHLQIDTFKGMIDLYFDHKD
jgi:hypothetical protein